MPKKGKLPEWEKQDNRKKIFLTLFGEPTTFTELLRKLPISRGTLSEHLKELESEKIIGKTRRNGKRVYQVILGDEEKIMDELKAIHFDLLLEMLGEFVDPLLGEVFKSYLESLLRNIIYFKKRELIGERRLSAQELMVNSFEIIKKGASPRLQKMMNVNEIIEGLKSAPESTFDELESYRSTINKKMKRGKKK